MVRQGQTPFQDRHSPIIAILPGTGGHFAKTGVKCIALCCTP